MFDYYLVFGVTLLTSIALVVTQRWHGCFSLDGTVGAQKQHTQPTPRIGGVAIVAGMIAAWLLAEPKVKTILGHVLLAGIPAFAIGLLEDITKKIGALTRLLATMFSGFLGYLITGIALQDTGINALDWLLSFTFVAVLFTAFAVGGVANAINIIDGFNGLAAGAVVIMISAIGLIAMNVGEVDLATVCFLFAAITLGFSVVNWPMGKLFLGDGGAYLLGFVLAWMAVKLTMSHVEINAWAGMLACAYPVLEVGFSVRRKSKRVGHHPGQPDKIHLHMLVHRRIARRLFPNISATLQNSMTSPVCWLFAALPAAWAVIFAQNTVMLIIGLCGATLAYAAVYARLTQFRWCLSALTLQRRLGPVKAS